MEQGEIFGSFLRQRKGRLEGAARSGSEQVLIFSGGLQDL
jgi:hypothetical protein